MEDYTTDDVLNIQPSLNTQDNTLVPLEEEGPDLIPNAMPEVAPDNPLNGDYSNTDEDSIQYADDSDFAPTTEADSPLSQTADAKRAEMQQKSEEKRARLAQKFNTAVTEVVPDPTVQTQEDYERSLIGDTEYNAMINESQPDAQRAAEEQMAQQMVDEQAQQQAQDETQYNENIVGYGVDKGGEWLLDKAEAVVGKDIANDIRGYGSMVTKLAGDVLKAPKGLADITGVDKENIAYDILDYFAEGGEALNKIDFGFDDTNLQLSGEHFKKNYLKNIDNGGNVGTALWDGLDALSPQFVIEGISQALPYGKALGAKLSISAPVFTSQVIDMSEEDIKARILNNGGKPLSAAEKTSIVAVNTALMALEKIAFDKILGTNAKKALIGYLGRNMTAAERAALKAKINSREALVDPGKLKLGVGERAANFGKNVAIGTAEEALQEGLQSAGSIYNQKYGTDAMDGANLSNADKADIAFGATTGALTGAGMAGTIGQYHEQRKISHDRKAQHMEDQYVFSQRRDQDLVEKHAPDLTANFNDTEANYELAPDILQNHDIITLDNGQEAIEIEVVGVNENGQPENQKIIYPVQKIGDKYTINNIDMQEAFPDATKEEIVNQMAPLVKDTNKIEDADSVVIDGQRWKKNPDYDPNFPGGYMQDGEYHSNDEWVQVSGRKDNVEQELSFEKEKDIEAAKQNLEKNKQAEIEKETKTQEQKISKTQKIIDMLDTGIKQAKKKFEEGKSKIEESTKTIDEKIKKVEEQKTKLQEIVDNQQARIDSREGRDNLSSTQKEALRKAKVKQAKARKDIENIDKKLAKLQQKKSTVKQDIDKQVAELKNTMDSRIEKINEAKSKKLESIKQYEEARDSTVSRVTKKYDTAQKKLESRGTVTGKPVKRLKRKYRDNLEDIMLKASEKAAGPLSKKRKESIKKIVKKMLREKSDQEIKDIYIKAFKEVHGEAAAQREAEQAAEAKNERIARHKNKKTETRKQSKPEPENFQQKIKDMQTITNEELPDIIEELARELDELNKDC